MNMTVHNVTAFGMEDLDGRDENLAKVEVAMLAVIFLITIVGNTIVLMALWTRKQYAGRKKLSRMYFFILHLSVADLITAFLSVLPQLAWDVTFRFQGGWLLCKVVKYGQLLGPYLSSYVLVATAIDRHQAICYPLTYCSWTSRRSKAMVWIAWGASLLLCVPQLTIFSYTEEDGKLDCWAQFPAWGQKAYVTWYSISVFIVPLIVLIVTYSSICREIWKSAVGELTTQPRTTTGKTSGKAIDKKVPLISRAKINTVKQTVAVIVMYTVCSTPFICAQLWNTWDPTNPFFQGPVYTILALLYSLNSCVNPWIYLAFNRELPRVLLRRYTASSYNYRTAAGTTYRYTCNSTSNSSGGVETTSLKPFSRWSMSNNTKTKYNGRNNRQNNNNCNATRWIVTTTT